MSLRWLMSFKDLEGQLARWLERLQEFEFDIIYRKGLSHKSSMWTTIVRQNKPPPPAPLAPEGRGLAGRKRSDWLRL